MTSGFLLYKESTLCLLWSRIFTLWGCCLTNSCSEGWCLYWPPLSFRWTLCRAMESVRLRAYTTITSTHMPASASAAGRRGCSGAPCSSTAAATPPGSPTPFRSPPTAPASGPSPQPAQDTHMQAQTHTEEDAWAMVLRGLGMSGETGAERIELTVGVDAFCCQLMMITAERLYWQGGGAAEHMRRQFPATGHSSSKCSTVSVMEENLSFPWKPVRSSLFLYSSYGVLNSSQIQ